MKVEPTIEMNLDYLANQVIKLDDINGQNRKRNRQVIINNRKKRMLTVLELTVGRFRQFRMKIVELEREVRHLRRQIDATVNQEILKENEELKAQLEELIPILAEKVSCDDADDERLCG